MDVLLLKHIWAALCGLREEGEDMKAKVGCFVGITEGKMKEKIGSEQNHTSQ